MEKNILYWLFVIGILIAFDAWIANAFARIAEDKGHSYVSYFGWCIGLGPLGYLMVIALPDRRARRVIVENPTPAAPAVKPKAASDELPDL